jgi:hypothetical protein
VINLTLAILVCVLFVVLLCRIADREAKGIGSDCLVSFLSHVSR